MLTARNKLFPTLSIQEYLSLSNQPSERKQGRLSNLKQSIGELSGGERQQLSLDKLSIPNAVTLLDEPFLGLDARAARHASEQLWEATNRLNGTLLIALPSSPD
jgi:energy-coupling factor transporter ATP-binding protein EcfA2